MPNPFLSRKRIEDTTQLLSRTKALESLEGYVLNKSVSAVVAGPEGCGKTALLDAYFNTERRAALIRDHQILVNFVTFPQHKTPEDIYGYLTESIDASLNLLESEDSEVYEAISKKLQEFKQNNETKESRFRSYLNQLKSFSLPNRGDCSYHLIFVVDNFERFTTSKHIGVEHHDILRSLLDASALQMIVATDYDFNDNSLPPGIRNSSLLTRLDPNKIKVTGLPLSDCTRYLEQALEDAGDPFRFTEEQLQTIQRLSGGIPLLADTVARHAYDLLTEQPNTEQWEQKVVKKSLKSLRPLFLSWCKFLTPLQKDLLTELPNKSALLTDDEDSIACEFENRGILISNKNDTFGYNSQLFKEFCLNTDGLSKALENNPLLEG